MRRRLLVHGALKALDIDAYSYYCERAEEGKQQIHEYLVGQWNQYEFNLYDVLKATDTHEFFREALGRFMEEGTSFCVGLEKFGESKGPGAGINLLPGPVREQSVRYWEERVSCFLEKYRRSDKYDFMSDVGAVPDGTILLLHRVRTRVDRLRTIKARI